MMNLLTLFHRKKKALPSYEKHFSYSYFPTKIVTPTVFHIIISEHAHTFCMKIFPYYILHIQFNFSLLSELFCD